MKHTHRCGLQGRRTDTHLLLIPGQKNKQVNRLCPVPHQHPRDTLHPIDTLNEAVIPGTDPNWNPIV